MNKLTRIETYNLFSKVHFWLLLGIVMGTSCERNISDDEIPEYVYAGGETTMFDITSNAYTFPAANLSSSNFDKHLEGDLAFEQIFVTEGADINPGLGPLFNNNSCVSCHIRNGRSKPSYDGDELSGFLIRLSVPGESLVGGPKPVPGFGGQLQNKAVFGQQREANFTVNEMEELVTYLDGSTVKLSKPVYEITDPYQPLPNDLMISPRIAPAVFGLGLLEAIPTSDILALTDEADVDNDGISGKANMVWNIREQAHTLGRFGWKAENPTAEQQTADAFHQDMGVTSSLFAEESCIDQSNCAEDDGEIDITDDFLDLTTFYFQTLAVPAMRDYEKASVQRGKLLFEKIQCASCHVPKHVTGTAVIAELSNQIIYPYTDMLLHDMGEGLSDNRPSFEAVGTEWRTPPLWGIGALSVVNGHTRLMHDGRANNIEEAILWHGGEAAASQEAFLALSSTERNDLLDFLHAL